MFVGHHERSLDKKGRLLIPARLLKKLPAEDGQISLYVVLQGDHLGVYSPDYFLGRVDEARPRGFTSDRDMTARMSLAEEIELDSANRLRLTVRHRTQANLGDSVVLVGVGDHLEIWNPDKLADVEQEFLERERASAGGGQA